MAAVTAVVVHMELLAMAMVRVVAFGCAALVRALSRPWCPKRRRRTKGIANNLARFVRHGPMC